MKRLLLVALMVLVSLVGMVRVMSAAGQNEDVIQQSLDAMSNDQINVLSALQTTANATNEAVGTLQATVNDGVPARAKMYYLTKNSFAEGDAITACDSGFHMASISEFQDPSKMQYAPRRTPAYDAPYDQVYGPPSYNAPAYDQRLGLPSNQMGWVRSGVYPLSGFVYDCEDFQGIRDNQAGTTLVFKDSSEVGAKQPVVTPDYVVHVAEHLRSQPEPVWCVEDPE